MSRFLRDILITLVLVLVIFFLLQFTVQNFIIIGASMQPNFQEGERVVANKVAYKLHEPERGDVIVFHPPGNRQEDYIKRIIALPGETVEVKNEVVYINGLPLDEPYPLNELPKYTLPQRKVPEKEYFVLGDNRNNSNDSHNNWTVPRGNIIGKAWLSIWPPSEWGAVPDYSPD
jgi:signal peptidase I